MKIFHCRFGIISSFLVHVCISRRSYFHSVFGSYFPIEKLQCFQPFYPLNKSGNEIQTIVAHRTPF